MTKKLFSGFFFCSIILLSITSKVSSQTATSTTSQATTTSETASTTPITKLPGDINNQAEVRAYFADIPVMMDIAGCESKYRQFADSGNVFRGGTGNNMTGIFQIDRTLHYNVALSMGMNIDTVAGNLAYAKYLYGRSGTGPWISSMPCWRAQPVIEGNGQSVTPTLTATLYFGINDPQVQTLQQILNRIGYVIAPSGSGSPGNETSLFGGLTRAAVRRFQCDQSIVCSGDEYSTSYGLVGPRTRAALLARASGTNTGTPSSPGPGSGSSDEAARIASVKAQIAALQSQIANLQAQVVNLQGQIR